jgi:hypothetical protein
MALTARMIGGGISAGQAKAICGNFSTLVATGSAQTDAATVKASTVTSTGADGTKGIILPATANPGEEVTIFNSAGSTLKVYPPVGAAIAVPGTGAGTANAAFSHTTFAVITYTCFSATQWVPNKSA